MNLRTGKINDEVYDRSVIKRLGDVYDRPRYGVPAYESVAAAVIAEDHPENAAGALVTAAAVCAGPYVDAARLALHKACNALVGQAAAPERASAVILLPEGSEEQTLRTLEDSLAETARTLRIRMTDGEVRVTSAVTRPTVTVHAAGRRMCAIDTERALPPVRMHLVVSKWTGLAGTALLARGRSDLANVFSTGFLHAAGALGTLTSVVPEARAMVAGRIPYAALVPCGTGGIYAALWQLTQQTGRGFEVSLPDIPIRQETIEICNQYDINPYTMEAAGALLAATPEPQALVRVWNDAGIHAAVIGELSEDRTMRIVNGEESACLNRPQGDALDGILN